MNKASNATKCNQYIHRQTNKQKIKEEEKERINAQHIFTKNKELLSQKFETEVALCAMRKGCSKARLMDGVCKTLTQQQQQQ